MDGAFLSPMGEPFRRSPEGKDGAAVWFAQADSDHDGALSPDEMQKDAGRFFAALDLNHDGEIDPAELVNYETVVAPPMVRMAGGMKPVRSDAEGRRVADMHQGSGGGFPEDDGNHPRTGLQGVPEPVAMADTNLNRGVSVQEFAAAAGRRFLALDSSHDGKLTPEELRNAPPPKR